MIITIQDVKQKFKVNWMTFLVGWRGFGVYQRLVTYTDIHEFATNNLESVNKSSPLLTDLAALATISYQEHNEIDSLLTKLSATEHTDYETEVRKWVICLLEKQLQELPDDPFKGLVELTEFWIELDSPDYKPHQIQGIDNNLTPPQYYTQENYRVELQRHKDWIEKEYQRLVPVK